MAGDRAGAVFRVRREAQQIESAWQRIIGDSYTSKKQIHLSADTPLTEFIAQEDPD
jgi:hypothetical protein